MATLAKLATNQINHTLGNKKNPHPLAFSTYAAFCNPECDSTKAELGKMKKQFKNNYLGSFAKLENAIKFLKVEPQDGENAEVIFRDQYLDLIDDNLTVHIFEN